MMVCREMLCSVLLLATLAHLTAATQHETRDCANNSEFHHTREFHCPWYTAYKGAEDYSGEQRLCRCRNSCRPVNMTCDLRGQWNIPTDMRDPGRFCEGEFDEPLKGGHTLQYWKSPRGYRVLCANIAELARWSVPADCNNGILTLNNRSSLCQTGNGTTSTSVVTTRMTATPPHVDITSEPKLAKSQIIRSTGGAEDHPVTVPEQTQQNQITYNKSSSGPSAIKEPSISALSGGLLVTMTALGAGLVGLFLGVLLSHLYHLCRGSIKLQENPQLVYDDAVGEGQEYHEIISPENKQPQDTTGLVYDYVLGKENTVVIDPTQYSYVETVNTQQKVLGGTQYCEVMG